MHPFGECKEWQKSLSCIWNCRWKWEWNGMEMDVNANGAEKGDLIGDAKQSKRKAG